MSCMIQQSKNELKDWVNSVSIQELRKFRKQKKLEEVSNTLARDRKDIPRDLFKHRMHYVLHGIQQEVENRKYQLISSQHEIIELS